MSERARKAKRFGAFVVFAFGLTVAMAANVKAAQHHSPGAQVPEGADSIGLAVGIVTGLAFGAVAIAHNFLSPPATGHPREKALRVLTWIMGGTTFFASYLHTWEVTAMAGETNPVLRALLSGIPDGVMFMGTALIEALAPAPVGEPAADVVEVAPVLVDVSPPTDRPPAIVVATPARDIDPAPVDIDTRPPAIQAPSSKLGIEAADSKPTRPAKPTRKATTTTKAAGKAGALAYLDEHGLVARGELVKATGVSDGTAGAALREWKRRQETVDGDDDTAETDGHPSLNGHHPATVT